MLKHFKESYYFEHMSRWWEGDVMNYRKTGVYAWEVPGLFCTSWKLFMCTSPVIMGLWLADADSVTAEESMNHCCSIQEKAEQDQLCLEKDFFHILLKFWWLGAMYGTEWGKGEDRWRMNFTISGSSSTSSNNSPLSRNYNFLICTWMLMTSLLFFHIDPSIFL